MKKKIWAVFLILTIILGAIPVYGGNDKLPYYITVNLTDNITTVYGLDENGKYTVAVKAFTCSVGNSTPEGTFRTTQKYRWRPLFGNVYGQYATRITGSILFHSVPYFKEDKSTLEYLEYNKLGQTVSMGCIRLTVEDVKWIYDNCPTGTTVKMYRGEVSEPLVPTKPVKIDINDDRRGWDPTDPDPKNPWNRGELHEMIVEDASAEKRITTLYQDGSYFVNKAQGEFLFEEIGLSIDLPEITKKTSKGTIDFKYKENTVPLSYETQDGVAYYKLRDIALATEARLQWNKVTGRIDLSYGHQYGSGKISFIRWILGGAEKTESLSLVVV